jgi:hypothetical protein
VFQKYTSLFPWIVIYLCGSFNDVDGSSNYVASDGRMNNEMERIWKEALVAFFEVISRHHHILSSGK